MRTVRTQVALGPAGGKLRPAAETAGVTQPRLVQGMVSPPDLGGSGSGFGEPRRLQARGGMAGHGFLEPPPLVDVLFR